MKFRSLLLAGLVFVSGGLSLTAQVINVRYSNDGLTTGFSAVPGSSATDFWNVVPSDPFANLPRHSLGLALLGPRCHGCGLRGGEF